MSAPQTNIERQKRQHRGPLIGIIAGVAFVALLLFVFLGDVTTPESELLDDGAAPVMPQTTAPATGSAADPVPAGN